jgi:hypothetical protein
LQFRYGFNVPDVENTLLDVYRKEPTVKKRQEIENRVLQELQERKDFEEGILPAGRVTRRRLSALNNATHFYNKEDSRIYCVYPPELEATVDLSSLMALFLFRLASFVLCFALLLPSFSSYFLHLGCCYHILW